ncbi:MAG: response regulator [Phycisphaerales bacterium]|nr:response regulator [Phycisphaerales bacterium]MCB9835718.1 response regulator [Phycisphaera sp.]
MNDFRPKILIVDNDVGLLMAVSTRLESIGCRCFKAQSGAQAMAELRRETFDLLVTDLNMPLGDGLAISTAFRRVSSAPIVVISGFVDNFLRQLDAIENVTIVEKPFDTHQLVGTIVGLLPKLDPAMREAC